MPSVGSYFQDTFDTIGDYMPELPMFGDDSDDEEVEYEEREDGTIERVPKRKGALSNFFKLRNRTNRNQIQEKSKRWYNKFFFGSDEESITTPAPIVETTTETRFFNWFGGNEETTAKAPVPTTAPPKSKFSKNLLCIHFVYVIAC